MDIGTGQLVSAENPRLPVTFGEIGRSPLDKLAEAMGPESVDLILQRHEQGGRCFAYWLENQIACYCWVSQRDEWIGEMEVHFRMQAGERYIWDCLTQTAFRRQGLYSALLNQIVRQLQLEGITRIWIGSNLENRPSIKGFMRAGFQPVVQVLFLRILSLRCFWIRPYPTVPKDFVSAARRAFSSEQALQINPFIIYPSL